MTTSGGIVESADATLSLEYQHFPAVKRYISYCNDDQK